MPRGGARPGAGRKKGYKEPKTLEKEAAREVKDSEREAIEVWEKDPSVQAFMDLMNRTLDMPAKPAEAVEHTGSIEVKWRE
jgi:hypothetical protein